MNKNLLLFSCILILILPACGGSGSNNSQTTTIGPEGGIASSSDGRLSLVIPAGALGNSTDITITELATEQNSAVDSSGRFLLEPEGLTFLAPVRVELQTNLVTELPSDDVDSGLVFLLSRTGNRVEIPANQSLDVDIDSSSAVISGEIMHFTEVFDNLPRDGGVRLRFSGIPNQVPVGDNVFTVTVTVTQQDGSPLRSDETLYGNLSVDPIKASSSSIDNVGFRDEGVVSFGTLTPLTAQTLTIAIVHDCPTAGVGAYGGVVEFRLFDVLALVTTLGFSVEVSTDNPEGTTGVKYFSRVKRQIRCGDANSDSEDSGGASDTVTPQPTPESSDEDSSTGGETEPISNTCNDEERVCQNTGQAPTCLSCACDDGFPIGDCNAICSDTMETPTQCIASGCTDGSDPQCPA